MFDYDLVVIGSGPAGHRGAVQAARLRKRVALVERGETVGGVCVNTGTIPSKTMREALMYLSGYREHLSYGVSYTVKQKITMKDLIVSGLVPSCGMKSTSSAISSCATASSC